MEDKIQLPFRIRTPTHGLLEEGQNIELLTAITIIIPDRVLVFYFTLSACTVFCEHLTVYSRPGQLIRHVGRLDVYKLAL